MRLKIALLLTIGRLLCAECPLKNLEVVMKVNSPYVVRGEMIFPTLVTIKYTNDTAKTIVGAKYRAVWLDVTGDPMPTFEVWTSDAKVKPGAERKEGWSEPPQATHNRGWYVTPVKILYSDGSTWEEVDKSCYAQTHYKNQPARSDPPATLFVR